MFALRQAPSGPRAAARTRRTARLPFASSLRHPTLEALEQRHLLTATVIEVDTFDDTIDPLDGLTSLREAVIQANNTPGDFEIHLPAGTYMLTRKGAGEDAALTGDLDILNNGSLRIIGADAASTIIDASGLFDESLGYGDRIFDVKGGVVELQGLTLTGGSVSHPNGGGAIFSLGDLTIKNSKLVDNTAIGTNGGAISARGSLSVVDATFAGNTARDGGAIWSRAADIATSITVRLTIRGSHLLNNTAARDGGAIYTTESMTVVDSTIANNTAAQGGGIYASSQSVPVNWVLFSIERSTVSGNTATGTGAGGIFNNGQMNISNTTISGNHANGEGGGIVNWVLVSDIFPSILTITNSTISGNSASIGGGIRNYLTMTIDNSTIVDNSATISTGGVLAVATTSILDLNQASANEDSSRSRRRAA